MEEALPRKVSLSMDCVAPEEEDDIGEVKENEGEDGRVSPKYGEEATDLNTSIDRLRRLLEEKKSISSPSSSCDGEFLRYTSFPCRLHPPQANFLLGRLLSSQTENAKTFPQADFYAQKLSQQQFQESRLSRIF